MELEILPKIGPKMVNLLKKLDIYNVNDLVNYYPYRYNVIKYVDINNCLENEVIYVKTKIISSCRVSYIKKNFNRLEFVGRNNNNKDFKIVIFNRAFLKRSLTLDKEVVVIGKYSRLKNTLVASDIKFNMDTERIEAIYHLTEGIKNSNIENFIVEALNAVKSVDDYVPDYLVSKYNFLSKMDAVRLAHFPNSYDDIKKSRLRLIYEELFIYSFKIQYLKSLNKKSIGLKKEFDENEIWEFLAGLSFQLTVDQMSTIKDILSDIKSDDRMNRLVLGDVGSGKTIVAIVACLANYLAGYQSTFMAPTEILAKQHYASIIEYFKNFDINIALLTGSMKKREKDLIYKGVVDGSIDIVIGTHALLNEALSFKKLGLVITDEQHRFGVNQRNLLQNKDGVGNTDVLYLSATPIPRTYALTIYGDLDLSQIKSKPNIRKEIKTYVVLEKNIRECLLKMFEELKMNHQIFVVCPLIETNDELDVNSVFELKTKLNKAFSERVRIEVLHGKLKQKDKDSLMEEFKKGDIKILISTTVIEVGIDIPNASMMVIFNSDRFGLATLHQLRGRVGRSDIQSYCYLITNSDDNLRLKVMEESSDGFYISEKDFEQRGQGDLFGVKQSGDMSFKIANFSRDFKILERANLDAKEFLESDKYTESKFYKEIIKEIDFLD